MKRLGKLAVIATLFAAKIAAAAETARRSKAVEYTVTDLGLHVRSVGINARGEIAANKEGDTNTCQAMIWSNGSWRVLGAFSGGKSVACGINDAGQVVGFATLSVPDQNKSFEHGFLYTKGAMTDLGQEGAGLERAVAINAAGLIAGQSDYKKAWCYDGATHTPLGVIPTSVSEMVFPAAINRRGEIVGSATVGVADGSEQDHAFLFSQGKLIDLGTLGGDYSLAEGISDHGWVVGRSRTREVSTGWGHAFLYRDGKMQDLGLPGGFENSDAKGVNAHGIIVGEASSVTGSGFLRINVNSHAYRYDAGVWTDLNVVVDLSSTEIQSLSTATAINDAGQIVGEGMAKDGWHGVALTPVAARGSR